MIQRETAVTDDPAIVERQVFNHRATFCIHDPLYQVPILDHVAHTHIFQPDSIILPDQSIHQLIAVRRAATSF